MRLLWTKGGHPRTLSMSEGLWAWLSTPDLASGSKQVEASNGPWTPISSTLASDACPRAPRADSKSAEGPRTARLIPLTTEAVRLRLRKLGQRAKVSHVTPHQFRHLWSVTWMLETQDAMSLKYLGGWRNMDMVERYSQAALEISAVKKARAVGLRLFGLDGS